MWAVFKSPAYFIGWTQIVSDFLRRTGTFLGMSHGSLSTGGCGPSSWEAWPRFMDGNALGFSCRFPWNPSWKSDFTKCREQIRELSVTLYWVPVGSRIFNQAARFPAFLGNLVTYGGWASVCGFFLIYIPVRWYSGFPFVPQQSITVIDETTHFDSLSSGYFCYSCFKVLVYPNTMMILEDYSIILEIKKNILPRELVFV